MGLLETVTQLTLCYVAGCYHLASTNNRLHSTYCWRRVTLVQFTLI